jgi:hypothetical protein
VTARKSKALRKPSRPAAPQAPEWDLDTALIALRRILKTTGSLSHDDLLHQLCTELGFKRLGPRLNKELSSVITTAGRRGIVQTIQGEIHLDWHTYHEAPRDVQKTVFLAALGRTWVTRDDAMTLAARYGGFARVSPPMQALFGSLINGLLRERRLEASGTRIRRT